VHGAADVVVPVQQSERYGAAATAAGDAVEVRVLSGDHMALIDPLGPEWQLVRNWLGDRRTRSVKRITLDT
jgi:predicted esterase